MSSHVYSFYELEPYKGFELFAYGEAEISYSRQGPDPDVGIRSAYYEYEIDKIWIFADSNKSMPPLKMELRPSDPLYKAIESRLLSDDYDNSVQESIEESLAP
jgi:hypothetical protein